MPPMPIMDINTKRVKLMAQYFREANKRSSYHGSYATCQGIDREYFYGLWGGPRAMRVVIRREYSRAMTQNAGGPEQTFKKYEIHVFKKLSIGSRPGGMFTQIWSSETLMEDGFHDSICRLGKLKHITKDNAISVCEKMGWKFAICDETTNRPCVEDFGYIKHKLYLNNFPWIKDPIVTCLHGDADYQWRQGKEYDYSAYGATSKQGNTFSSLWNPGCGNPSINMAVVVPNTKAAGAKA